MNKLIALIIVLMLAVSAFFSFTFVVSEKDTAIKLRFGAISEKDIIPGLHGKVPFFDEIVTFDARIQVLNLRQESYKTSGSEILDVSSFVQWRILSSEVFYKNASGNVERAREIITARTNAILRAEFGKLTTKEVISGKRDEMLQLTLNSLKPQILESLGVDIVDLKIQTIQLQSSILEKVYDRMISERQKVAQEDRSEGRKEQIEIESKADRSKVEIEVAAYRDAEIIRGEGDAQAAKIYADAYSVDSEFYAFLRSLKAYEASIGKTGDVLVLDQKDPFFRYLNNGSIIE